MSDRDVTKAEPVSNETSDGIETKPELVSNETSDGVETIAKLVSNETTEIPPQDKEATNERRPGGDGPDPTRTSVEAATAGVTEGAGHVVPVSKNQLKKQRRWDKLMEIKKRRKLQDKQVKHERAKVQGRNLVEEQARQEAARINGENRLQRRQDWERVQLPRISQTFQVCLDCAFEPQMTRKEINSLALQIRYCYSLNKRNTHPCQLTATSIDALQNDNHASASTLQHLQKVSGFDEWTNWAFTMTPRSLEEHYGASMMPNVVYLTSDSDTVLHELDATKIYVIGAIVDRNRLQRATLNRANELGVATARLPIEEHLAAMAATKVLTVNHVFELLLEYRKCNDWKMALHAVLPSRKDAKFESEDHNESNKKAKIDNGTNP